MEAGDEGKNGGGTLVNVPGAEERKEKAAPEEEEEEEEEQESRDHGKR